MESRFYYVLKLSHDGHGSIHFLAKCMPELSEMRSILHSNQKRSYSRPVLHRAEESMIIAKDRYVLHRII